MAARLTKLWDGVSTSLWFLPANLTAGALLLAWATLAFPIRLPEGRTVWWLHSGSAESATNLLSSLLTAMITMATLAISITMVVLTLAAAQLGPRLIRSFMADKRTQLALGFFLATIIYLVVVLHLINGGPRTGGVPHLAVTLGTVFVAFCVFVLLLFVHHLARSIVADAVIQRVGLDLDAAIAQMLPTDGECREPPEQLPQRLQDAAVLRVGRGGYIQVIDYPGLVECARKAGAVIELSFRPGQHLLPGGNHGRVAPAAALTEALQAEISARVVLGGARTPSQDLEFAIRQIVEVAIRALSPGINDPFTAIAAIDRLGISLSQAMRRGAADGVWRDRDGKPRVIGKTTTFQGIFEAAFNQIRQAGDDHPAVLIRMLATFARLADQARHEEHRRVLTQHVNMVFAAGERSIAEPRDLEAMKARRTLALARLGRN